MPFPRPSLGCLKRNLIRPRVVVPLVLVLAAVVAFAGYGAWTRSRPVHFARGGDAFASLPAAPDLIPASSTPTPTPSATPTKSAAPPPVVPSAQPVRRVAPGPRAVAELVLPRPGRYGLHVEGSEKVDFGPVSFCSQTLPSSAELVVSRAAGESPTSFDFDVPYFPGQAGRHDERHLYRYTGAGVLLDYEIATVTCQGVRQSSDTEFSPPQVRVRLPLAVGASWTNEGGDADRTESSSSRVTRTESVRVGSVVVPAWVIETTTSFTGSESGSRTQTWWYAPGWAMPVKWSEHIDGRRSGAAYSEDVTVTVTSRP